MSTHVLPSVSVALATFNGDRFLAKLLDSLAGQQYIPLELVVSDDGSTDDSLEIVEAFARRAPFPVRIFRNDNRLGYRANFMHAAELCQGDIIAFCDQDDVWHSAKLAACAAAFDDPAVLLVHHNAEVITESGDRVGNLWGADSMVSSETLRPWLFALGFTQVFRACLLRLNQFWPLSRDQNVGGVPMGHDQWFFFLASTFGKLARLDDVLVDYRQHSANTVGWVSASEQPSWWRYKLEYRGAVFALCAADMEARAAILDEIGDANTAGWSAKSKVAARQYAELGRLYRSRQLAYDAANLKQRYCHLRAVQAAHGYSAAGNWTFQSKALSRDLIKGVVLGPIFRRFGLTASGGDPECCSTNIRAYVTPKPAEPGTAALPNDPSG